MNEQEIENEIRAKGLEAPRVKPEDIEANIAYETYFSAYGGAILSFWANAPLIDDELSDEAAESMLEKYAKDEPKEDGPLGTVTICAMVLRNGIKIIGVNEGPVSPENFDPEMGRRLARQKAIDQIWPMMGYELRCRLARAAAALEGGEA